MVSDYDVQLTFESPNPDLQYYRKDDIVQLEPSTVWRAFNKIADTTRRPDVKGGNLKGRDMFIIVGTSTKHHYSYDYW